MSFWHAVIDKPLPNSPHSPPRDDAVILAELFAVRRGESSPLEDAETSARLPVDECRVCGEEILLGTRDGRVVAFDPNLSRHGCAGA